MGERPPTPHIDPGTERVEQGDEDLKCIGGIVLVRVGGGRESVR